MKTFDHIEDRINWKSAALIYAAVLAFFGIIMTCWGGGPWQGGGGIEFKMKSFLVIIDIGSVGLLLVFISAIVVIIDMVSANKPHTISIKKNGLKISWEGKSRSLARMSENMCVLWKAACKDDIDAKKANFKNTNA